MKCFWSLVIFSAILYVFSCKGEPLKTIDIKSYAQIETKNESQIKNIISDSTDCYNYLTELVRSSNFPFSYWKVNSKKVNILIDEENDEKIQAKLFIESDGTGTIGWIEYNKNDGKLLNNSADLEEPQVLTYDNKWKNAYDDCSNINVRNDYNYNSLPFDFEEFYDTCYDNQIKCNKIYPQYFGNEQTKILLKFGINNDPTSIFMLPKFKEFQPILLAYTDSDIEGYNLVITKNNRIVFQKTIGEMDGETIKDFKILNNYEIELFERNLFILCASSKCF
jgi:hypothetical protein